MENQKPIKLKIKLAGGEGSIIGKGIVEELIIEVIDGIATYRFTNPRITKVFAAKQFDDGVESVYVERLQKTICKYPGLDQKAIVKHISERLTFLGKTKK